MRCRLNAPLMVLAYRDNHQAATTVPAGQTVDVLGPDHDDRFSIISVDGEEFLAFEGDLLERGTLLMRKEAQLQGLHKVRRAAGG
jgi:hypothetical protein